jgi:hypothetical protein
VMFNLKLTISSPYLERSNIIELLVGHDIFALS